MLEEIKVFEAGLSSFLAGPFDGHILVVTVPIFTTLAWILDGVSYDTYALVRLGC